MTRESGATGARRAGPADARPPSRTPWPWPGSAARLPRRTTLLLPPPLLEPRRARCSCACSRPSAPTTSEPSTPRPVRRPSLMLTDPAASPSEFGRGPSNKAKLPKEELQLYVWADTTLRELCTLVRQEYTAAQQRSARLHFQLLYPDSSGNMAARELGLVFASGRGGSSREENQTLRELKVMTGDFVGCPQKCASGYYGTAAVLL